MHQNTQKIDLQIDLQKSKQLFTVEFLNGCPMISEGAETKKSVAMSDREDEGRPRGIAKVQSKGGSSCRAQSNFTASLRPRRTRSIAPFWKPMPWPNGFRQT